MGFLIIPIIAVVVIAVLVANAIKSGDVDKAWAGAAEELGVGFSPAGFLTKRAIKGKKDGVSFEVAEEGSNDQNHTTFKATAKGLPPTLAVRAEGIRTSLGKIFSGEDVLLGDPGFDG